MKLLKMRIHLKLLEQMIEHSSVDKKTLEERFNANIKSAEEYLRPEGKISRSRAGLLFIEAYRELPLLAWPRKLIDSFVELEESMVLFRTHHAPVSYTHLTLPTKRIV